jgi:ornithine decarboxylase
MLSITLKKLHSLVSAHGRFTSSFYAISQARVNSQMALWRKSLPTIKPFYAVKCNPDPTLMKWLAEEGAGFDCASARELNLVGDLYIPTAIAPPEIVFANPCKKGDEIFYSGRKVNTTVIDSEEELEKLTNKSWIGTSLVRIRVGDSGSRMPFGAKFGADLDSVSSLAKKAAKLGQRLSGVSFHVGSGCGNPTQYADAIREALYAIVCLQQAGHTATTLDIGGGFTQEGFEGAAATIQKALATVPKSIRVIAEPGRFFAASCQDLFVRVIAKKPAAKGRKGWRYTIDDSLYGQFSCIPYDHSTPRWIRVRGSNEAERPRSAAVLYGRTCDSVDMIAAAASTEELEVGDWLWFPKMGAYTSVTSTEFNGFPKPRTLTLEAHRPEQLPSPQEFSEAAWPSGLRYVSAVQVPTDL